MNLTKIALSTLLVSTLAGNVVAEELAQCPSKDMITEHQEQEGYSYTAPGPHGRIWVGENPFGSAGDQKTFQFTGALYRDISSEGNRDVVSCDYEGEDWFAFARMTLYSFLDWKPAPKTQWKADANKTGAYKKSKAVQFCVSSTQEDCAFNYRELSKHAATQ